MNDSRYIETRMKYILAMLLCLVLISFWWMSGIYARYSAESTGTDSARVALFGQNERITLSKDWTTNLLPGSSGSYNLKVTNKNDSGAVSEVTQEYTIEIKTAGNLPFVYTLQTKDGKTVGTFSETGSSKSTTFSTEDMKFEAGKASEQEYTLKVVWPENANSASLQGIPDFTKITIQTKQID